MEKEIKKPVEDVVVNESQETTKNEFLTLADQFADSMIKIINEDDGDALVLIGSTLRKDEKKKVFIRGIGGTGNDIIRLFAELFKNEEMMLFASVAMMYINDNKTKKEETNDGTHE